MRPNRLPLIDLFYEKRYSHTRMTNPDFVLLAQAMGVHAIRCHSAEELPAKMKEFLEYDGSRPVLMDCQVEKNEHVFPMVSTFFPVVLYSVLISLDSPGGCWQGPPRAVATSHSQNKTKSIVLRRHSRTLWLSSTLLNCTIYHRLLEGAGL
jgi:hypothetical protein